MEPPESVQQIIYVITTIVKRRISRARNGRYVARVEAVRPLTAACDEPACGWRISTLPRFGVQWTDGLLARQADFLR